MPGLFSVEKAQLPIQDGSENPVNQGPSVAFSGLWSDWDPPVPTQVALASRYMAPNGASVYCIALVNLGGPTTIVSWG